MHIVGPDARDYGEIERWDDEFVYLNGRRIPLTMIERHDDAHLYVGAAGARTFADSDSVRTDVGDDVRVPIVEERLAVGKRQINLGDILVHKSVDTAEERRALPITRDDVQVERVPVNRTVAAPETPRQDGEWFVIPVMEEVLVVQKQLVVTEEIRIRRQPVTEQREVRETVRHERVTVEDTRPPDARVAPANLGTSDEAGWEELHEEVDRAADR
jgi:uncharacterized protein (TIGR02271 family)